MEFANRIRKILASLTQGLVERDVAVRLALLAALAGEHLLLVGPPGTAKSLVARRLRHAFKDAGYFERLLTRFSVPEELFGPLSIKGLEEDRYERLTESYLPTAHIAFLDEIFKANSAILNALLTLLNEREFDNGIRREAAPLMAVVGASNELPEGEELDALFDRFLLRLNVDPVSKDAFPYLLKLKGDDPPRICEDFQLIKDDLDVIREKAKNVLVPDEVMGLLCDLRDWCGAEKIPVSDRRWRKIVKLLQMSAQAEEREVVSIWDCWLLQYCLWSKIEDREKIYRWYTSQVGATAKETSNLSYMVGVYEKQLQKDKDSKSQKQSEEGKVLYLGKDGKETDNYAGQDYRDGQPLYKNPENLYRHKESSKGVTVEEVKRIHQRYAYHDDDTWKEYIANKGNHFMVKLDPMLIPTRHKPDYISKRVMDLKELHAEMKTHRDEVDNQIETLENDIYKHLWVVDNFMEHASQFLKKARSDVDKLLQRVEKVIRGYNDLPKEEEEIKP